MATYYISGLGDDNLNGTSEGSAWATIDKVNSYTFSIGDNILFRRGDIFFGQLIIKNAGNLSNYITVGAYGFGAMPIITSFVTIGSNWTSIGNGLYTYNNPELLSDLKVVQFDGVLKGKGRTPGYSMITSADPNDTWLGNNNGDVDFNIDYVGAELLIKKQSFITQTSVITSQEIGKFYYGADLPNQGTYPPMVGYGFFIQNHISTLTGLGDWMYNGSTKTLTMYFGTNEPSNYVVKIPTKLNCIRINSPYIRIQNIETIGSVSHNIYNPASNYVEVVSCKNSFAGDNGTIFEKFNMLGGLFKDNKVHDVHCSGFYVNFNSSGTVVEDCYFHEIGLIAGGAGLYGNSDGRHLGIGIEAGTDNISRRNRVKNIGFNGIVNTGSGFVIEDNVVDSFNMVKDDGAGIYCSLGGGSFMEMKAQGRVVNNRILNAIGNNEGTPHDTPTVHGIYMDDLQHNTLIEGNLVAYSRNGGIYLHNAYQINILNNTLFSNKKALIYSQDGGLTIRNINVEGNYLVTNELDQIFSSAFSTSDDISQFGTYSNNKYYYVQNNIGMFHSYSGGTLPHNFSITVQDWFNKVGEIGSEMIEMEKAVPITYSSTVLFEQFYGTSFDVNGSENGSFSSMKNNCTATFDNDRAILARSGDGVAFAYMNIGDVDSALNYVLTILASSVSAKSVSLLLEQNFDSAYGAVQPNFLELETTEKEFKILLNQFTAKSNEKLMWLMEGDFSNLAINSIKFESVEFDFVSKMIMISNLETEIQEFNFESNYKNIETGVISNSFVLQPLEFVLLEQTNENPPNHGSTNIPSPFLVNIID